jgi:hypothetical protein
MKTWNNLHQPHQTYFGQVWQLPALTITQQRSMSNSPTALTLYLLKHNGLVYIQTDNIAFPDNDTPIAKIWLQKTTNHSHIIINLSRKYLHQLLLLNITTLEQITLPNIMNIMNEKEFHQYHKNPHPLLKKFSKSHHTYSVPQHVQLHAGHHAIFINNHTHYSQKLQTNLTKTSIIIHS